MGNKILVVFVISIFFLLCLQVAAASTITVPDDYPTIQEAVLASAPGDTISVLSGTYSEDITIDKELSLLGEGKETTVIEGSGSGHAIRITSDGVEVSGFMVKGSGTEYLGPFDGGDAGIILDGVTECTISDNTLTQNNVGIFLNVSDKNTLEGNVVYENSKDGIYGRYSNNNVIRGNKVTSNGGHGGIYLNPENSYNLIENNVANYNVPEHGIKIQTNSNYNVLRNNTCLYNGDGIYLSDAHHNNITNNICSNSSERNGIMLRLSENNLVSGNIIEFNPDHGLDLDFLNFNNTLRDNICSKNINGIALRLGSHHNKVINNTCNSNERAGIEIEHSDYNEIYYNTISMNADGINVILIDSNPDNDWNSIAQWDYAMEKFKDLVEERASRGLNIGSEDSAGTEIHWNIIEGNPVAGINSGIPSDINATHNWWGDASGPFHNQKNTEGKGDEIVERNTGAILFQPWMESSTLGTEQAEEEENGEEIPSTPSPVSPADFSGPGGVHGDNTYLIIIAVALVILVVLVLGYMRFRK